MDDFSPTPPEILEQEERTRQAIERCLAEPKPDRRVLEGRNTPAREAIVNTFKLDTAPYPVVLVSYHRLMLAHVVTVADERRFPDAIVQRFVSDVELEFFIGGPQALISLKAVDAYRELLDHHRTEPL